MDYLEFVQIKQHIFKRWATECTPHRVIFEEEMGRTQVLENRMEYSTIVRSMERTRAAAQPRIPQNLVEYSRYLVDDRYSHLYRTANGVSMFRGFVMGVPDAGSSAVFISPSLENLFASAQELHIDATFKSRPQIPATEQLLIIMAIYMYQAFPVAYALMTRRTEEAYRSVLNHIRTCVPGISAMNIVTDYEVALSNALANVFPRVRLQKCWFRMTQTLEKNAKYFGLQRQVYRDDISLHTMFRMSKAVALLPTNYVAEGFEAIVNKAGHSPNVEVAQRYITYLRVQLMERVGPENFTMHGMPRRTNNNQEIFHHHLNSHMNSPHHGIWHFTKRRRGSDRGNINREEVPAPFREIIEVEQTNQFGQVLFENSEHNIVDGLRRQQNFIQDRLQQQQINAAQFAVENETDFKFPEEQDPIFNIINKMEQRRLAQEQQNLFYIAVDENILLPIQINCCDICLGNQNTLACIPCGQKCLCSDCAEQIINRCPICNNEITNIIRIFE